MKNETRFTRFACRMDDIFKSAKENELLEMQLEDFLIAAASVNNTSMEADMLGMNEKEEEDTKHRRINKMNRLFIKMDKTFTFMTAQPAFTLDTYNQYQVVKYWGLYRDLALYRQSK